MLKNVKGKLSDGKLGHLSTTVNNNTNDFILSSYIFLCENISFRAKKASLARTFALLLQCKKIGNRIDRL